jgi:RimJ/RimL family protein N-acetyltransferase
VVLGGGPTILSRWVCPALATGRLELEPLQVEHAEETAPLFDDERLHRFIGGRPATVDELRSRYARQVLGRSADGCERWFNWIVRHHGMGAAIGMVQATVTSQQNVPAADVAWVIASSSQRRGYAREASAAMVAWLRTQGASVITAHIHPDHTGSIAVARALGLTPTDVMVRGEVRWLAENRAAASG